MRRTQAQRSRRPARTINPRSGGFLGIELKFYDNKLVSTALAAPSDATGGELDPSGASSLTTVAQGDGESNRDGRKLRARSIYVEGQIKTSTQSTESTADAQALIFLALVLDTQSNGAALNSEDVYANPGASANTAAGPFRNLQFTKRFKVLATRRFIIQNPNIANETGATGGLVQNGLSKRFKFFKKLNFDIIYKGTTADIANTVDNSLHIIGFTTSTAMAPQINYISRFRFVG